jgi:hypothetical protein
MFADQMGDEPTSTHRLMWLEDPAASEATEKRGRAGANMARPAPTVPRGPPYGL